MRWQAPATLTYAPLVMRITVVVDQTTTCEGYYKAGAVRFVNPVDP
jgi:hypothetical protein